MGNTGCKSLTGVLYVYDEEQRPAYRAGFALDIVIVLGLHVTSKDRRDEEAGFEQGFYDLPSPHVRALMTPEKLAILLSKQAPGTPAYILVEHELNLRIAKVQARAAYVGIFAALAGTVLGAFLQAIFSQQYAQTVPHPHESAVHSKEQGPVAAPNLSASSSILLPSQGVQTKASGSKDQKELSSGKQHP